MLELRKLVLEVKNTRFGGLTMVEFLGSGWVF
jgi:hypothetical protein